MLNVIALIFLIFNWESVWGFLQILFYASLAAVVVTVLLGATGFLPEPTAQSGPTNKRKSTPRTASRPMSDETMRSRSAVTDWQSGSDIISGLIVDEPWIGKILAGEKTWEMRSRPSTKRERIALVRKGSGLVVGVATIQDCRGPLTDQELLLHQDKHRVPLSQIGKWRYAWVLTDVLRLDSPIRYVHKPGAVIFVRLDATSSAALTSELRRDEQPR